MVRYLGKKLRNDAIPEMMSGTLEANIIERIPKISSETYRTPGKEKKVISQKSYTPLGEASLAS